MMEPDYRDFRPSLQLASVLFYDKPLFSLQHQVSEALYWLGLNEPPLKQQSQLFKEGGYAVLQNNNTKAIIRFPCFRFRPSQADALHMDLWHKGQNVLRDSGSYSYNTEEKWLKYFSGTRSHNTIEFDDRDQMPKVSRFLFGKWLTTNLLTEIEQKANQLSWSAGYTDYKGCSHQRQISVSDNCWKITDKIRGKFNKAMLRWRLIPEQWIINNNICQSEKAKIEITCNVDIKRIKITEGWESRYYLEKTALPVLEIEIAAQTAAIFTTIITLH
ncbi:heparinase II/III family protein [Candidatus Marithrix sp. Canyon 246]|uniref:heparinase II/III family protein n=1 Tax=Candidatus Marithrix sp. Canyon 246 TaxID=1827136 RepID=UPI000AE1D40B|nr:heparinase II/III-family protein [Candidatus Marithrix sp. Canyon 246]